MYRIFDHLRSKAALGLALKRVHPVMHDQLMLAKTRGNHGGAQS